jgi:hypothetical protein
MSLLTMGSALIVAAVAMSVLAAVGALVEKKRPSSG